MYQAPCLAFRELRPGHEKILLDEGVREGEARSRLAQNSLDTDAHSNMQPATDWSSDARMLHAYLGGNSHNRQMVHHPLLLCL